MRAVRCARQVATKKGKAIRTNIGGLSRNGKGVRGLASILLLSAALAGCVSNGRIPQTWSQTPPASSTCEQLQGRFANAGATPRTAILLTQVLMFAGRSADKASEVRLTIGPDGVATFVPDIGADAAAGTATPSTRLVLTCEQGVLTWSGSIRDLRENNIGDPLMGPDRIAFRVQRGSDRALYVETHEVLGGLAYGFIPIGGSQTMRFRFPAAD